MNRETLFVIVVKTSPDKTGATFQLPLTFVQMGRTESATIIIPVKSGTRLLAPLSQSVLPCPVHRFRGC